MTFNPRRKGHGAGVLLVVLLCSALFGWWALSGPSNERDQADQSEDATVQALQQTSSMMKTLALRMKQGEVGDEN